MSASTDPKYMVLLTEAEMRAVAHALYTMWSKTPAHESAFKAIREKLTELQKERGERLYASGRAMIEGVVLDDVAREIEKRILKEKGNG